MKIALIYPDRYLPIPRKLFLDTLQELGHQGEHLYLQDILFQTSSKGFQAHSFKTSLLDYDGYIIRQVGKRFKQVMVLVHWLKKNHKKVLNQHFALGKSHTNKLATAELLARHQIPQIKTFFPNHKGHIREIFEKIKGPLVVKHLTSSKGEKIKKFDPGDQEIYAFFKSRNLRDYLFQEFIPYDQDIRVFVVGGRAIAGLRRVPPKNEFIANISQGAKAREIKITPAVKRISEKVASVLPDPILGVDLVSYKNKYLVVEVNCSPGLGGYTKKTRIKIIQAVLKLLKN